MRVGFLTFDSTVHFYNLQQGLSQPQMLVVSDIDGMTTSPYKLNFSLIMSNNNVKFYSQPQIWVTFSRKHIENVSIKV